MSKADHSRTHATHPTLPQRIGHRLTERPATLIAAAAVLAIGLALRDRGLARGGGRMLTLDVSRRVIEGAFGHAGEGEAATGAAAAIPAAAAWAAGMLADRLFSTDPVQAGAA